MLWKDLGGVSEDARRTATWTVKFGLLQAAVKLAKEDNQARRLDPAEADYSGESLLTADELAKPVAFSSVTMQFNSSTAGSRRIGSSVDTTNVHFENQGVRACMRAIPLQVIDSHDPSADLFFSVQLEEGHLATPARIQPSLLNNPIYCDIAFTFPNVCPPLFAYKLVLVQQSPHFADLFRSGFAQGTADYALPTPLKIRDCRMLFEGDLAEFAEFEPPKDNESDQAATDSTVVKNGQSGDLEMKCASNDASTSSETPSPPKCTAKTPTSTVGDPNSTADTTARLGEKLSQKRWHRIEISGCSWATFRTYLQTLYYDAGEWLPSRSKYLANVYKDRDACPGTPKRVNRPPSV
ncbi:hypothetical protein JCM10296v2_007704 [Rhodotorula toruloides]